jgi:hypothetical protein
VYPKKRRPPVANDNDENHGPIGGLICVGLALVILLII